jgi:hypothetical protein
MYLSSHPPGVTTALVRDAGLEAVEQATEIQIEGTTPDPCLRG